MSFLKDVDPNVKLLCLMVVFFACAVNYAVLNGAPPRTVAPTPEKPAEKVEIPARVRTFIVTCPNCGTRLSVEPPSTGAIGAVVKKAN